MAWVSAFSDSFTRANGAIGANYEALFGDDGTDAHGSTAIVTNKLVSAITADAGGANPLLVARVVNSSLAQTVARQRISITLGAFSGTPNSSVQIDLYLHSPDGDIGASGLEWSHNYQTGVESLGVFTDTDFTAAVAPSLSPGDVITLEDDGSGNIIAKVNGITVATTTGGIISAGTATLQLSASGFQIASVAVDDFDVSYWTSLPASSTVWTLPNDAVGDLCVITLEDVGDLLAGDEIPGSFRKGESLDVTSLLGDDQVGVPGDYSNIDVAIGLRYETDIQLSKLYVREQTQDGGSAAKTDVITQVQNVKAKYDKTGAFKITVLPTGRSTAYVSEFVGTGNTEEGTLVAPVLNNNEQVEIHIKNNTCHRPFAIVGLAWDSIVSQKTRR